MIICRVTLVGMLLACLSYCVLAEDMAAESRRTAQAAASTTASAPAVKPLVITLDDKNKTFAATVGQPVEVRLDGMRAKTGWETIAPLHGVLESADNEFIPLAEAPDPAMGTYVFRYKAAKAGQATLSFQYITPGGPGVNGRDKARRVDQFKVVINVEEQTAGAPTATSASTKPN